MMKLCYILIEERFQWFCPKPVDHTCALLFTINVSQVVLPEIFFFLDWKALLGYIC